MAPLPNQAHDQGTLKHSHHHHAPSPSQSSPSVEAGTSTALPKDEQIIREYAYHLYEERHYAHGHDVEDWIEAELSLAPVDADRAAASQNVKMALI